ncbi:MAG: UDP-glucose 6-dehydrogenase, partial [Planctomycetes bacterium]|nr:UDP-glucose 6-dehydrogenase [Planctomycetota bacterium]
FSLLGKVLEVNRRQAERFLGKITSRFGDALAGKTAAVWGLAYKPGTDDVRESPALAIVAELANRGCRMRVYDPAAMDNFRAALPHLGCDYAHSAAAAAEGADFLLILTEWEEFTGFPLERLGRLMGEKIIFDGRNCFSRGSAEAHRFVYHSVGRLAVEAPPTT